MWHNHTLGSQQRKLSPTDPAEWTGLGGYIYTASTCVSTQHTAHTVPDIKNDLENIARQL